MVTYHGSPTGIRFILFSYKLLGYRPIKWAVFLIAFFYAFVSRSKRFELYGYYARIGLKPSLYTYIQHIYSFSLTIFDRFIAKQGMQESQISVERVNIESFEKITESGGIVLLSHLGNWAQSFKIFETYDVSLNIVMAEAIGEELASVENLAAANERVNVIDMNKGMQSVLDIAGALLRHEVVIMMADRIVNPEKSLAVPFLGDTACFNSGPFEIARMRQSPIVGLCIIRDGDGRLKIEASDPIDTQKGKKLLPVMEEYTDFLGKIVRKYPLQWFNFYDFWGVQCKGRA